jgi:hypothetical protein
MIRWRENLEAAREEARGAKKSVLLFLYSPT